MVLVASVLNVVVLPVDAVLELIWPETRPPPDWTALVRAPFALICPPLLMGFNVLEIVRAPLL